eukprot:3919254-Prorocentrum_lima.AAC.1
MGWTRFHWCEVTYQHQPHAFLQRVSLLCGQEVGPSRHDVLRWRRLGALAQQGNLTPVEEGEAR